MFNKHLLNSLEQHGLSQVCLLLQSPTSVTYVSLKEKTHFIQVLRGYLMTQQVKNLPAMQETQEMEVWSLGQEDPLEEAIATHSSILAWKSPWTEEPGGLQSKESQKVGHN